MGRGGVMEGLGNGGMGSKIKDQDLDSNCMEKTEPHLP